MFEKFSAKPHLPLNRPFFKDQNTVMLSRDHGKTLKISKIQPCQVCHNKRFAVFFLLPPFWVILNKILKLAR